MRQYSFAFIKLDGLFRDLLALQPALKFLGLLDLLLDGLEILQTQKF